MKYTYTIVGLIIFAALFAVVISTPAKGSSTSKVSYAEGDGVRGGRQIAGGGSGVRNGRSGDSGVRGRLDGGEGVKGRVGGEGIRGRGLSGAAITGPKGGTGELKPNAFA